MRADPKGKHQTPLALTETPLLVRIHWVAPETGACGCGQPIPRDIAEAVIRDVAPRYPYLQHWIADA